MSKEVTACKKWLMARISTDPQIQALVGNRVFHRIALQGTAFPYVVFASYAMRDYRGGAGKRTHSQFLFVVKAVGKGVADTDLEAISERIDALMESAAPAIQDNVHILSARREEPLEYDETLDNERVNHLGGIYRLFCHRDAINP